MDHVVGRVVWLDDDVFPGWACVEVAAASGSPVEVQDKQPVIAIEKLTVGGVVYLECDVIEETSRAVTVELRHGVETTAWVSVLVVAPEAIVARN